MTYGLCCLGAFFALGLPDAPPDPPESYELETVVRSSRREESLRDVPYSITVLDEDAIGNGRPAQSLGEALNQVPGLLSTSQFNASQDLRLSVRGFGARSAFGVRGVRVFLDGVPLTVPDGSSALDVIDPALVQRVEVLRGPAAALYGSAASAVILIETRRGNGRPFQLRGSAGDNGLLRASASQSGKTDGGDWLLAASNQQWAGQRQQSASRSATAVSRLRMQLAERSELTLTLLGHNGPQARDPGGLTAEDAEDDPTQAAAINRRFRTGEQVRQGQGGLRYRYRGERWYSEASAFGWARQFRARVPFRAVELERWVGGGRFVIGYDHGALRLETGIESELQRDRRRNYGNDDGVVTDELRLRQDENLTTTAWLSQAEWRSPARTLRVRGAARIDRFSYALTDRLLEDGDGSGVRDFTVGTALLGAVWRPTSDLDLFGNYSVSYDVPTLGELAQSTTSGAQPVSGLARDLGPTQIQSVEFGARGGWEPLRYEGTVFYARSDDEIISRELSPGLSVFQNAGVSERAGVEAQGALRWREFDVILQGSYLWTALKNDELITGFGLDDRERIPGAPEWLTYGQLRYRAGNGLFAAYELRGRGEVSVGPQLSEIAWVSHARAGFTLPITEGDLTLSFGVRNLTDARYSDNFRPNAAGARFFEPAPGRWVYFNLAISAGEHN